MLDSGQLWDNVFMLLVLAVVIDIAVNAIFSIDYIENFLESTVGKSVKNILVILIAFGLCYKIPQLRLLGGSKIKIPDTVHLVLTSLFLAQMTNLIHELFLYLRNRTSGH